MLSFGHEKTTGWLITLLMQKTMVAAALAGAYPHYQSVSECTGCLVCVYREQAFEVLQAVCTAPAKEVFQCTSKH